MDINSLLSPQETPASETPPTTANASPRKAKRPGRPTKRTSSNLSQQLQVTSSPRPPPQDQAPQSLPSLAFHNVALQAQQMTPLSPGAIRNAYSATTTPTPGSEGRGPLLESRLTPTTAHAQPPLQRQPSGMDTLADLASMQHHQQAGSPTMASISYNLQNLRRSGSTRSSRDLSMTDLPSQPPRVFTARSLSTEDSQAITELAEHLDKNPNDYASHVRFIKLLHRGVVDTTEDPHSYELLTDLRQAREAMDAKFSVGEELWVDWISDEMVLASSLDERLRVMELCGKAIGEEPSSSLLWRQYGEYMYSLWAAAHGVSTEDVEGWSAEDQEVGREVFKWEPMMSIWEQGAAATQWHMSDSHLVWDRWFEILMQDQTRRPSPEKLQNLRLLFTERLMKPHATWDQTFQAFSTFISTYDNASYEETMVTMNQRATQAKQQFSLREVHEFKIRRAIENSDKDAEWQAYSDYLDWEMRKKGIFSFNLINALYERAALRFSSSSTLWQDYIELLMEHPNEPVSLLSVLDRATRHCPWSGDLWSQRLLTLEAEGKDFIEIEDVKHKATKTGLLDVGGMEELLKVYIAWCGFLRRRAFSSLATEDELDVAEVGIRSAFEHVAEIGAEKYGKDYQGDPLYRLERIHIKFYSQSGNTAAARDIWRSLVSRQGDSYDFWYRYYIWEMVIWGLTTPRNAANNQVRTPTEATALLRQALTRVQSMDWPESLVQMFLNHCEQHESVQELRSALVQVRRAEKKITKRREQEAAAAAAAYAQQQQTQTQLQQEQLITPPEDIKDSAKRKRDAGAEDGSSPKKSRQDEPDAQQPHFGDPSSSATSQLKRDRENATVVVKGLPAEATETRVRQFFRDCGVINSIALLDESDSGGKSATIEFEAQEDALSARIKSGKLFDGNEIEVTLGTGTTLWVTNFPPTADEAYLRDLFSPFGHIVEIRLPSLKYNTHRRFCYIQFLTADQAQAATSLNGKALEGDLHLVAKISAPQEKQSREGALYDGREIFVGNLPFSATEEAVKERFEQYGKVERVRIPKNIVGKGKGVGFVVFETKEQAEAAAQQANGLNFNGRKLNVNISVPNAKGAKRVSSTIVRSASSEPSPSDPTAISQPQQNGSLHLAARDSTPDPDPAAAAAPAPATNRKERTIALLNVPDTVSDARLRALLEPHGRLRKIILRPDHQGAIVEFEHVQDVGKAGLAVEGAEVAPGRRVRVGSVEELMQTQAEKKVDRIGGGGKDKEKRKGGSGARDAAVMAGSTFVSRPAQPGARRRGRGGLGVKRGGVGLSRPRVTGTEGASVGGDVQMAGVGGIEGGVGKSNADFKAMFLKGNSNEGE